MSEDTPRMDTTAAALQEERRRVLEMRQLQSKIRFVIQQTVDTSLTSSDLANFARSMSAIPNRMRRFVTGGQSLSCDADSPADRVFMDRLERYVSLKAKELDLDAETCSLLARTKSIMLASGLSERQIGLSMLPVEAINIAYELKLLKQAQAPDLTNLLFAEAFGEDRDLVVRVLDLRLEAIGRLCLIEDGEAKYTEAARRISDTLCEPETFPDKLKNGLAETQAVYTHIREVYSWLYGRLLEVGRYSAEDLYKKAGYIRTQHRSILKSETARLSVRRAVQILHALLVIADEHALPVPSEYRTFVTSRFTEEEPLSEDEPAESDIPSPLPALTTSVSAPPRPSPVGILSDIDNATLVGEVLLRQLQGTLPPGVLRLPTDTSSRTLEPELKALAESDAFYRYCYGTLEMLLELLKQMMKQAPITHRPSRRDLIKLALEMVKTLNPERDAALLREAHTGDGIISRLSDIYG